DSVYMAGLVSRLEHSFLKEVSNEILFALLWELKWLLDRRAHPYFIQHVRSRTSLPGPISEGNTQADKLAGVTVLPDHFAQACLSHEFYHQNAKALQCMFQLTQDQARQIIQSCPDCHQILLSPTIRTNP
ncbi:POK18 protein, partial [Chunga burmeisteri]|nr:POK18 protein [Chunga burmeisteri]